MTNFSGLSTYGLTAQERVTSTPSTLFVGYGALFYWSQWFGLENLASIGVGAVLVEQHCWNRHAAIVSSTDEVEMSRSVLLWVSFVLLAAEMTAALAVALTYCLLLSGRRSGSVGYAAT